MSPRTFILVALLLSVNFTGVSAAPSSGHSTTRRTKMGHSPGKKPKLEPKETPEAQHTTIALISGDTISIAAGKETKTYKIDQQTQIELKGVRATVADLKPGMRVSITPGVDASLAGYILAADPPKAPTTAAKPKGKK
jgi:hypothetical protein